MLPTNVNPLVYVAEPNQSSQIHSIIDVNNFDVSITSTYNNATHEYDTYIYMVNDSENLIMEVNNYTTSPQIVSDQITTIDVFVFEGNYSNFHLFDFSTNSSNYLFSNINGSTTYGTTKDFLTLNNNQLYINSSISNSNYTNGLYTTYVKLNNNIQKLNIFVMGIPPNIIYVNINNNFINLSTNILDVVHTLSNSISYTNCHIADLHSNYFGNNITFKFCDADGNNESTQSGLYILQETAQVTGLILTSTPSAGIFTTYIKVINDTNTTITIEKVVIRIIENTAEIPPVIMSDLNNVDPITFKDFLINNFTLKQYNTDYSTISSLITSTSDTINSNTPVTLIPFKANDTLNVTFKDVQKFTPGKVLYFVGTAQNTLNLTITENNYPLTLTEDGVNLDGITYKLDDYIVINDITFIVKLVGSIGLQIITNPLIISTYFVNSPFAVNQNTSVYAQNVLDTNYYDYIMTANISSIWSNNMNTLFNTRSFQEDTINMNKYNVYLDTNADAIDSLLSNNTIMLTSTNSEITSANAYNTLDNAPRPLGLRFLEIIATKVFGHAKARAAIANDSDFYKRNNITGSVMQQITKGIHNAVVNKRNEIFNMYVAYDRIQDNNNDDVYTTSTFNFANTEWSFPFRLGVSVDDLGFPTDALNNGPNVGGVHFINGTMSVPILLKFK